MTSKQKNAFIILLVLAIVLIYTFSGGSVGISLDFGEESLAVGASSYDWTIPYDRIVSLDLADLPDTGVCVDGIEKSSLCCGTWENELWREYTLCISPKIDRVIVITLDGGDIFVLNYENGEATESLHQMFTELLQSKGYPT